MSQGERRVPDVLLERYLVSLLKEETRARVEALLEASVADAARLEELRIESEAFLLQHPPGPLVAHIECTLRVKQREPRWWWGMLAAPVLIGLGLLALPVVSPAPHFAETVPVAKGNSVVLRVHRKIDEGSVVVGTEEVLAPGDVIRFEVRLTEAGFLAVIGRDAADQVTLFHAEKGNSPVPQPLGLTVLPSAFELDERPGTEEIYALFSPAPFELAPIIQVLEQGRPVDEGLPEGVQVTARMLKKRR
jgi:hypothetical protein